jgi:adrenodoxin-NADP+ reductase
VREEAGPSRANAVAWNDWRKIDQAERERGQINGKEREKFTKTADMLAVLE